MPILLEPSWQKTLAAELEKPYFGELMGFVNSEYESHTCFPPKSELFAAFEHTPFDRVKVVILGQDPYHGPGMANGLCFSVANGVAIPRSLQNIFKELRDDIGAEIPTHGNLAHWANQGVLLLNVVLSVRIGEADSHKNKGWEKFTDAVISKLSSERDQLVFLLWGGKARKKGAKINEDRHLVLHSGHPSPMSANSGHWFGNKHFSKTNEYLLKNNKGKIKW